MKNALILFPEIGPYHAARISALHDSLLALGIELYAFRFAANSRDYSWAPQKSEVAQTITLSDHPPKQLSDYLYLCVKFYQSLLDLKIDYAFLPSYSPLPNLLCLIVAKICGCRTILMSESWGQTANNSLFVLIIKRCLISLFDSALVGGTPQAKYIESLGMRPSSIFHGYDVIDVDYFSGFRLQGSDSAIALSSILPKRYFLSLGRFVKKKT
jgi:hypothetical protein